MTSIKAFRLLGLLIGLISVSATSEGTGHHRLPERNLDELCVIGGKDFIGQVIRDGDRFVAIGPSKSGEKRGYLHNFEKSGDMLWVDERYLGYDLRGKYKNVLVRKLPNKKVTAQDLQDIEWEFVLGEKGTPFKGYFRVKNGELKGWWIGLGTVEEEKKGEQTPRNRRGSRAPLILVKDKKDAAGFSWSDDPPDDK